MPRIKEPRSGKTSIAPLGALIQFDFMTFNLFVSFVFLVVNIQITNCNPAYPSP